MILSIAWFIFNMFSSYCLWLIWYCNFIDFGIIVFLSYVLDINMDRVEDVLLHKKLLAKAKDPDDQPAFHIRFLEVHLTVFGSR